MALTVAGCSGMPQKEVILRDATTLSNGAAVTISTAQATAMLLYEAHQVAYVETEAAKEGATKAKIRAGLEQIREDWEPVKELFKQAIDVHGVLTELIERGDDLITLAEQTKKLMELQAEIADFISDKREEVSNLK